MKALRQVPSMVNRKDPNHPAWFLSVLVDLTRELPPAMGEGAGGGHDQVHLGLQLCRQLRADLGPAS